MDLALVPGAERTQVWEIIDTRLRQFLESQGVSAVSVEESAAGPCRHPLRGKLRSGQKRMVSLNFAAGADHNREEERVRTVSSDLGQLLVSSAEEAER